MTDGPSYYDHLEFNAPLSVDRADALSRRIAAQAPGNVVDIGCGWGELLLRILQRCPDAHGLGVDTDERLLDRGRAAAAAYDLGERARFENLPGADLTEPADLVVCIGSSHAFGEGLDTALTALHALVRPGGRLLFGEGFWDPRGPVDESLVWEDMLDLAGLGGLVDRAVASGFRPLYIETANSDEWDAFESGYLADDEEWLMANAGHEKAQQLRDQADEHRSRWLRGYRNGLGFAYLTLGVPA